MNRSKRDKVFAYFKKHGFNESTRILARQFDCTTKQIGNYKRMLQQMETSQ